VPGSLDKKGGKRFHLSCIFCYICKRFHLFQHSSLTQPTQYISKLYNQGLIIASGQLLHHLKSEGVDEQKLCAEHRCCCCQGFAGHWAGRARTLCQLTLRTSVMHQLIVQHHVLCQLTDQVSVIFFRVCRIRGLPNNL
jgi:hypothetical protein